MPDKERLERFLPLKPLVLDVLLSLADGSRHGWSLIRELQHGAVMSERILPANFYRTLRLLRDDGLIGEVPSRLEDGDERRQYFELTELGAKTACAELRRLKALVIDPRARRLLGAR